MSSSVVVVGAPVVLERLRVGGEDGPRRGRRDRSELEPVREASVRDRLVERPDHLEEPAHRAVPLGLEQRDGPGRLVEAPRAEMRDPGLAGGLLGGRPSAELGLGVSGASPGRGRAGASPGWTQPKVVNSRAPSRIIRIRREAATSRPSTSARRMSRVGSKSARLASSLARAASPRISYVSSATSTTSWRRANARDVAAREAPEPESRDRWRTGDLDGASSAVVGLLIGRPRRTCASCARRPRSG